MTAPRRVVRSRCLNAEVWMTGAEADCGVDGFANREPIGGSPMAQDGVHFLADKGTIPVESD